MADLQTLHSLVAASPALATSVKLLAAVARVAVRPSELSRATIDRASAAQPAPPPPPESAGRSIFQEPWWLDAVSGGRWRQVSFSRGGRIVGVLPYAVERIGPLTSIEAPALTHTLGPLIVTEGSKPESRQRGAQQVLGELLDQLPPADRVLLTLPPEATDTLPYQARGWRVGIQHTFLLDCARPIPAIWGDLRDKTRNLVRRARERLEVVEITDPAILIDFYRRNLGRERAYFDLDLIGPAHEAAVARGRGRMLGAWDESGQLHAAVFIVWDSTTAYYLVSTRDDRLADSGAVSLLVWQALEEAQRRGLTFDFDGVISAATAQFIMGFGGRIAARFVCEKAGPRWRAYAAMRGLADRMRGQPRALFQGVAY